MLVPEDASVHRIFSKPRNKFRRSQVDVYRHLKRMDPWMQALQYKVRWQKNLAAMRVSTLPLFPPAYTTKLHGVNPTGYEVEREEINLHVSLFVKQGVRSVTLLLIPVRSYSSVKNDFDAIFFTHVLYLRVPQLECWLPRTFHIEQLLGYGELVKVRDT